MTLQRQYLLLKELDQQNNGMYLFYTRVRW